MKRFVKLSLLLFFPVFLMSQPAESQLDSLHKSLKNATNDTIRMDVYLNLALYYNEINRDSSLLYLANGLPIAQKLNLKLYEAHFFENRGYMLMQIGNYPKALESFLASFIILEDTKSENYAWNLHIGRTPRNDRLNKLGYLHLTMGHLYGRTNHTDKQISSYQQSMAIAESVQNTELVALANWNLGNVYIRLNKLDSALHFVQTTLGLEEGKYSGGVLNSIGQIYELKGDYELALDAYRKSLNHGLERNNRTGIASSSLSLSSLFFTLNQPDSSLYYSRTALATSKITKGYWPMAGAYQLISDVYSNQEKADSAYIYLKLAMAIRDSLNNAERENLLEYQSMGFDEQLRLQKLEQEKIQTQNRIRTYSMLAGIAVFMLIAFLLYRNNQNRKKANELLQSQKEEIAQQKTSLEQTLMNLKSAQSQLIHSEKMASLGELTAGIAHEIQNPLNFVNNFSEVNAELLQELKQELDNGNLEEVKAIADDLAENEGKINHHGKRADAIVKGMLQHSRASSGQKEPTDINALADEYLRLSYHGFRARDKSFNASFEVHFDPNPPQAEVVPQDIGRVLLNLINNAFYAVNEKAKKGIPDYNPQVVVTTKRNGQFIEIRVSDNADGIPDEIVKKIFQPFFTTKPAGQGTGLGLSLSYDIVTKGHGGSLEVKTVLGQGSEFIISIPSGYESVK
jgi:two-component system, NtrC family, sensor kinase